jgi:hypothetical protein
MDRRSKEQQAKPKAKYQEQRAAESIDKLEQNDRIFLGSDEEGLSIHWALSHQPIPNQWVDVPEEAFVGLALTEVCVKATKKGKVRAEISI